jgi:hypothetical protein
MTVNITWCSTVAKFRIKGVNELKRNLSRIAMRNPKVLGKALFDEAENIMAASKRIVPVDFGALRSSGHVEKPEIRGMDVSVTMGYGGAAADYAIPVHEIPPPPRKSSGGRSARHRPPTQWKYLEQPFKAARRGLTERLGRKVKAELRRSVRR